MMDSINNSSCIGPGDCGAFFLEIVGYYTPEQLAVDWTDQRRERNDRVEEMIKTAWSEQKKAAEDDGRMLYNGPLCRLLDYTANDNELRLRLGPVTFKEFVGTNLANPHLRYLYGSEVLADPLGLSAVVVSRDGFIILGRRGMQVYRHGGRIHPIGGMMSPEAGSGQRPNPFQWMLREIMEEINIPADMIPVKHCIGAVRDKETYQPELIFNLQVDADAKTILTTAGVAMDAKEHCDILTVRNDSTYVLGFIQQNYHELTPVGIAAMMLHGLRLWGSGWLSTAIGYIQSVTLDPDR